MFKKIKLEEAKADPSKEEFKCKGLFWRYTVSSFLSSHNSIEVSKSLRLLKRRSCPGCTTCGWLFDYFQEDIGIDGPVDYIGELEHGKIYTYNVVTSQGFEDSYPEIDYIEFVEVKENDE